MSAVEGEQTAVDAGIDDGGVAVEFDEEEEDEHAGGQADEARYRPAPSAAPEINSSLHLGSFDAGSLHQARNKDGSIV